MNIEVEVRSFVSKDKFDSVMMFFKKEAKLIKEDYQETYYFDCEQDLRIQKNNYFSKVWLKKGKIHDDAREEIEVRVPKESFEELERLFLALDYKTKIKWFRNRTEFEWNDVTVCMDYTRGYGYIIELEILTTLDKKEESLSKLKELLKSLNVEPTSKEEFDKQFKNYKENWQQLIQE